MKTLVATTLLALLALPALGAPALAQDPALPDDLALSASAAGVGVEAEAGPGGVGAGGSSPPALPPGVYFGECKGGRFTLYNIIGVAVLSGYCAGGDWFFKTVLL